MENDKELLGSRKEEKGITIRNIFDFVVYNWYWFLLSVVVFTVAGLLISKVLTPLYNASTTIFVDQEYTRTMNSNVTEMRPARMFGSGNGMEDEKQIIKSRTLMLGVVDSLDANVHYYRKGQLSEREIYRNSSPVKLTMVGEVRSKFELKMNIADSTTFSGTLTYRTPEGDKVKREIVARYGEEIEAGEVARFTVDKTAVYDRFRDEIGDYINVRGENPVVAAMDYARELVVVLVDKQSSVMSLSLKDHVARKVTEMVNTLVDAYNRDAIESKRATAMAGKQFIDDRLREVEAELYELDSQIAAFQKKNESINMSAEAQSYLESSNKYQELYIFNEIQFEIVGGVRKTLDEGGDYRPLPAGLGINDNVLARSIDNYNGLVLQWLSLGGSSSPANPVVRELNTMIESSQVALRESVENSYRELALRRKTLSDQLDELMGKVGELPTVNKEILSVSRNQATKSGLYSFLLQRQEETALRMAATAPIAKVIDVAIVNNNPVSPNKGIIMLVSLVLGLMLPLLVIYLRETLSLKVSRVGEVERGLDVPVIGAIPSIERGVKDDKIVAPNSRDAITEAFRMVRTNLDFTMPQGGKVIIVTSSVPGEGKSFVSINLSLTLAIAGKKVVLVDLDLRKASLSERVSGKRQVKGLVNYLVNKENDIDNLIQHNAMQSVDLLYVGVIPPNPAELLIGKRIDEAFEELKKRYDYVIVDTPPVGLVTDTMIIDRVADLTLFSVRVGHSFKSSLNAINAMGQRKALRNLNVVITDIGASRNYTREDSHGYGYGYGYGQDKKANWRTKFRLFVRRKLKK